MMAIHCPREARMPQFIPHGVIWAGLSTTRNRLSAAAILFRISRVPSSDIPSATRISKPPCGSS